MPNPRGRPAGPPSTPLNVRVPDANLAKIMADLRPGQNRSQWINEAIEAKLRTAAKRKASPPIDRTHTHEFQLLVGTKFGAAGKTKVHRCICGETEERPA